MGLQQERGGGGESYHRGRGRGCRCHNERDDGIKNIMDGIGEGERERVKRKGRKGH